MKPTIASFVLACALTPLIACTTPATGDAPAPSTAQAAPEATGTDCIARGGTLVRQGKLQREVCAMPYADAGKACRDDNDCLGECRSDAPDLVPGQAATGTCQRHDQDRFGCYATIDDGKAQRTICVD